MYVNMCLCILLYFFIGSFPPFVLCHPDLRLSSLIVFYCFFYIPVCFLPRDRKGMGLDGRKEGEELADRGGSKTIIWIYCMKVFSI